MPSFFFREAEKTGDPFCEIRQLSLHPVLEGILFTMRSNMTDKQGKMFNNTQTHVFLEMEQIRGLANLLVLYIQEYGDGKHKNELP